MATKASNKELLQQATEKLGAEAVQKAISGAGLQTAAINALQDTNVGNTDISPSKTIKTEPIINNTQTQDNITTNNLVDKGMLPENQRENIPQIEPTQKTETPKIETPIKTETTPKIETSTPQITDLSKIQTVEDWKKQTGGGINNLENWIETRYNTTATQKDGVITANIGGVDYQWIIDEAGNPIKTKAGGESTKDIFNQLMTGVELPDTGIKQTKEYTTAKRLYDTYNQYKNYSVDDFSSALKGGGLMPGTKLYEYLSQDPDIKIKLDKANSLNQINQESTDITLYGENKTSEVLNDPTISTYLSDNYISPEEFNSMVNTPDITAKAKELENLKNDVDEKQNTYDDIRRQIEEKYKGTGASKVEIERLIAQTQKDLLPGLNLAISKYNNAYGTYTDMKQDSIDLFKTNLGFYQQQQARQYEQQQLQEQRQYEYAMLQDQRAYEKANAGVKTQMITDPATGQQALINSSTGEVIKTYDTGLKPDTMTAQQKAQYDLDVKKFGLEQAKFNLENGITNGNEGLTITSGTTQNRPDRNNNPGNLKMGDVGYGVDNQNHTIFGDAGQGYQALLEDIQAKVSGNSKWGLTPNSTLADLGKIYAEDPDWTKGVVHIANKQGYNINLSTKLGQIDVNKLAPAIAKQEGFTGSIKETQAPITNSDIVAYNSATPSEKSKILKTNIGKAITEARKEVFDNPNADIKDILTYSQGGDTINQTAETQLSKFGQALSQVGDLSKEIEDIDTGPIMGIIKSNNPYDIKAQSLKAQLSALIPNLARGVYGEVGVLTDNDIANYSKTVPNLKSTKEVNDAILGMTLKGIANGYKNKLQSLASAGYDVSGYTGLYESINNIVDNLINPAGSEIEDLRAQIFGGGESTTGVGTTNTGNISNIGQMSDQDAINYYFSNNQ